MHLYWRRINENCSEQLGQVRELVKCNCNGAIDSTMNCSEQLDWSLESRLHDKSSAIWDEPSEIACMSLQLFNQCVRICNCIAQEQLGAIELNLRNDKQTRINMSTSQNDHTRRQPVD